MKNTIVRVRRLIHGRSVLAWGGGALASIGVAAVFLVSERAELAIALLALATLAGIGLLLIHVALLRGRIDDTQALLAVEMGLVRGGLQVEDFFLDGAAANPSLQLLNLKILSLCRPRETLELGSGQTTKVLAAYRRRRPESKVLSLEQDISWAEHLRAQGCDGVRHCPLISTEVSLPGVSKRLSTEWYDADALLEGRKFDYILVDGPDHGVGAAERSSLSRAGILNHLPSILAPSFIIVFDDVERLGETNTVSACAAMLSASKIAFFQFYVYGGKTQAVLCSGDRKFLQSV